MRRGWTGSAALATILAVQTAAAGELTTTIDLDYKYEQSNTAGDVEAGVDYLQKVEVKYESALSPAFDFAGAARIELEDGWRTDEASTTRTAPTLELEARGDQASLKLSYQAVLTETDAFEESAATESYSRIAEADLKLTPTYWPEVTLKLSDRRELEPGRSDRAARSLEFTTRKDIAGLVLSYELKREWTVDSLPVQGDSDSATWTGKVAYKEILWGGTQFELTYEIDESYSVENERGVFVSDDGVSEQQLKTRLQKTLELTPRSSLKLGWEYTFDQDLLGLDYDIKASNKYQALLRWDPVNSVKLSADYKREDRADRNLLPQEDEEQLTDAIVLAADFDPWTLLRISTKASLKWDQEVRDASGKSVDSEREEIYETILRNRLGDWWELTLNSSTKLQHEEGWLTSEEGKFRGEATIKLLDGLEIKPTWEYVRLTSWEPRLPDPESQRQTREWKIKFDYRRKYLDLLEMTFAHEYGQKAEDELDAVLDLKSTLQLDEETRLALSVTDLIAGLKVQGEIDRRATDVEDDGDPMVVDVSYGLRVDYKLDPVSVSSSLKYNDKGDAFDDLTFGAKLEWRGEELALAGEYTYEKVYAEETDEGRTLQLKFQYEF